MITENRLNDLFFEAGYLFCEFCEMKSRERKDWFHIYRKDCLTKEELDKICEIMSEQVSEYEMVCDYSILQEYIEIFVRRKEYV